MKTSSTGSKNGWTGPAFEFASDFFPQPRPIGCAAPIERHRGLRPRALHERAETEFAARFGRIEGAATALVAAGSLASRAMTLASELELLFLYDAPEDAESDGPEKLPAPIYFDRFLTCMLSALGSRRGLSDSYKVALLFPRDGNAGPCAVGLAAFERLLYASAGPRERSASARARAVFAAAPAPRACKRASAASRWSLSTRNNSAATLPQRARGSRKRRRAAAEVSTPSRLSPNTCCSARLRAFRRAGQTERRLQRWRTGARYPARTPSGFSTRGGSGRGSARFKT